MERWELLGYDSIRINPLCPLIEQVLNMCLTDMLEAHPNH